MVSFKAVLLHLLQADSLGVAVDYVDENMLNVIFMWNAGGTDRGWTIGRGRGWGSGKDSGS